VSAIRVSVRASRLERPVWQTEMIARLRALPGVEVVETYEARLLLPADLFIDPTDSLPSPEAALHPRLGIWRFVYGPEARLSDACALEHAAGERGVIVRLVSIDDAGAARVLETGVFKTVVHSLSATRTRMFGSVADWPARALRRVLAEPEFLANCASVPIPMTHAPRTGTQTFARQLRNFTRRVAHETIEERWTIGIIDKPVHHVIDRFDARDIHWLEPPANTALADPVGALAHDDGRLTVLAEEYDFEDRQGRIVALDVHQGRMVSPPRVVLRLRTHLSYPHLVARGGEIYCVPEMSGLNRIQLFRAEHFPDRWVPDRILLNSFAGADATIAHHAGRWWLFTGDNNDQDETKLFVFHATDLFGPWQPHAANPVKCDLRSARSAGPLFEHNGALYRPAQDGSRAYGGALAVNRICRLTPSEFAEETVQVLRPDPAGPCPDGLHSLCGVGRKTLVDGKRHARSFKRLAWGLKQLARPRRPDPGPEHGSPEIR
jgi:hypothetical protein